MLEFLKKIINRIFSRKIKMLNKPEKYVVSNEFESKENNLIEEVKIQKNEKIEIQKTQDSGEFDSYKYFSDLIRSSENYDKYIETQKKYLETRKKMYQLKEELKKEIENN